MLIPALVEPGRGYDAVENSALLLNILRRYGFHLVLHGHKHNPYVFSEDSRSAWSDVSQPIVIAAGGSVGSSGLPYENYQHATNCYNRIVIKWHPAAGEARIQVLTRGLEIFNDDRTKALPRNWRWKTLREDDRTFGDNTCPMAVNNNYRQFDAGLSAEEQVRRNEYARLRGNQAVAEVQCSLLPGQAYEARVWIVPHNERELPVDVTWHAGPNFPAVTIRREEDPHFCAAFHYWDSMLVQALLKFADGDVQAAHVYARLPKSYAEVKEWASNA